MAWCCKANEKTNPLDSKPGKTNPAPTNSNALTTRVTTLLITPYAHTGNTTLTENSTQRKHKSSERSELTQFA